MTDAELELAASYRPASRGRLRAWEVRRLVVQVATVVAVCVGLYVALWSFLGFLGDGYSGVRCTEPDRFGVVQCFDSRGPVVTVP